MCVMQNKMFIYEIDMFGEMMFIQMVFRRKVFLKPHRVFWLMFLSLHSRFQVLRPSKEGGLQSEEAKQGI